MHAVVERVGGLATLFIGAVASLALACSALLISATASAQDTPRMEIGASAGLTILSASGSRAVTNFGVPAGIGPQSSPMMYATIFATPSVMVEPQIGFSRVSDGSVSFSSLSFVGQVGYLFNSGGSASPYVAVGGAFQWDKASIPDFFMNSAFSLGGPGIGGEVGYRFIVKSALGVRVNGRYRRWFSDYSGLNEIGIGVSLGAVL